MRKVTKLLLAIGLALTFSTPAAALITLSLIQAGGTCVSNGAHSCIAAPGDTLVLDIQYSVGTGDSFTGIAPGIVFDGSVSFFDAASSTETGIACWGGGCTDPPPIIIMIGPNPLDPNQAMGWQKTCTGAGGCTAPCTFGACTSMGTAAFVLSGSSGRIYVGNVGLNGGTVVTDGTFMDIAGNPALVSLGSFTIIPEPTTASLLGLALVGLAAATRLRKR